MSRYAQIEKAARAFVDGPGPHQDPVAYMRNIDAMDKALNLPRDHPEAGAVERVKAAIYEADRKAGEADLSHTQAISAMAHAAIRALQPGGVGEGLKGFGELYLHAIREERRGQDAKWGEQNHDDDRWHLILSEEVGEVAKAILHATDPAEPKYDPLGDGQIENEIVQSAAVCVAWLESRARQREAEAAAGEGEASHE